MSVEGAARPGPGSCPHCGAPLRADQDWCLECGAAGRTRLAAAPNWRAPVALLAVLAVACVGALAFAFTRLANTDPEVTARTTTLPAAAAPAPAPAPAPPAPTAAPVPTATAPPATTPPGPSVPPSTTAPHPSVPPSTTAPRPSVPPAPSPAGG